MKLSGRMQHARIHIQGGHQVLFPSSGPNVSLVATLTSSFLTHAGAFLPQIDGGGWVGDLFWDGGGLDGRGRPCVISHFLSLAAEDFADSCVCVTPVA